MSHPYKTAAKSAHDSKLSRMCYGGSKTSKHATGGKVEGTPASAPKPMAKGGLKAHGHKAAHRLDKPSRAKGGKVSKMEWEHSKKDLAEDKKLAKKHGMTLEAWEKSKLDVKHDTQQSMKGLKRGGHAMWPAERDKVMVDRVREEAMMPKESAAHARLAMSHSKHGGKVPHRATGGRVKKGKAHTQVNIVMGAHPNRTPMPEMVPMTGAGMVAPVRPPMALGPTAGGPPPLPAGAGAAPLPPPMRARGGKVQDEKKAKLTPAKVEGMKAGTQVTHTSGKNDLLDIRDYPPITKRAGGGVGHKFPKMEYGAGSGEGRLEKIEKYGRKG
jgi:hypothetical protein